MRTHTTANDALPARATLAQAAEYLNCSERSVRRYIAQGRITAVRIGPRLIRIDRASLEKLAQPVGGAR